MTWWGPVSSYNKDNGLQIRYGYDDDLYEGDDWTFYYGFDQENTKLFVDMIGTGNNHEAVTEYISTHFDSRLKLEEFCEKNGIHGTRRDSGEYPPAHFEYEF